MRRVKRDVKHKPAILTQQKILDSIAELVQTGDTLKIRDSYYQAPYVDAEGKQQSHIRDELNKYYHGKCAYCETDCKAEIEHYRPKRSVKDAPAHLGYYWLCYEWSNLLPSCHDCNTAGGKGTQFPVAGTRLSSLTYLLSRLPDPAAILPTGTLLASEQPFLLHPEIDDPDQYLKVELDPQGEGIRLTGIDGPNQRGEQTIRITNLNRTPLKTGRLRTLTTFVKGINSVLGLLASGQLPFANLEASLIIFFKEMDDDARDVRHQHTMVLRQSILTASQFSRLVLPLLTPNSRAIAEAAFIEYRLQNPF